MIFKIQNIIEIDVNFFNCCGYECCFEDGVLTVYYDPGFVPNYPNDLKPFKSELDKMVKERTYHVKWQVKVSQITRSIAARLKRKTTVD